ncbi:MAG TPA: DUF4416 family protein, partial [Firmicutes bacterium]|nr:DUF4416 family protein [Bacillota bacterium]
MGEIRYPGPKKIICGFIYPHPEIYEKAADALREEYGKTDFESEQMPFKHTLYYGDEMTGGLFRRFVSFEKNTAPENLAEIKIFTNSLEEKYSGEKGFRKINIDPGLLSMAKVILATTKNYSHRI